ncbi:MAG TPA: MFS transporter [Macromonas sp.]|nr:MFS transporter [Macromonas sp.]
MSRSLSALAPLRLPLFRMLWIASLMANVTMWMNDVAAAWTMTTMTTNPLWVALVQTASTAPVFLLGLPSGAMADTLDRKKFFMLTQLWVTLVAAVLSAVVFLNGLSPGLLLALTFANGIGMAMRWPVLAAVIPEVVPRTELPTALGLNSMSMNASRIVGPIVAGALIASAGSAWVFLLNAVLSVGTVVLISRWQREHTPSPLGREPLWTAMRVGLQYVGQSAPLKGILLFSALTFFHLTALTALLPLVAHRLEGGAGTFTLLLSTMGAGAVAATLLVPHLRHRFSRDALLLGCSVVLSAGTATIALTPHTWVAVAAMGLFGGAWFTQANVLSVAAQVCLPDWVRARGMALFQMSVMGAGAAGAALWGQVASHTSVSHSLGLAAVTGLLSMALALRLRPDSGRVDDLTPHRQFIAPQTDTPPPPGRVLVQIEFRIDPTRADDFRALMREESRSSRLRLGARSWELLEDLDTPGRFLEIFEETSWTDHLRRYDRITAADVALRERRLAFHLNNDPPAVTRFLMESTVRRADL